MSSENVEPENYTRKDLRDVRPKYADGLLGIIPRLQIAWSVLWHHDKRIEDLEVRVKKLEEKG